MNNLPSDYEQCGECGFDHEYEYSYAYNWHVQHTIENKEIAERDCLTIPKEGVP